MPGRSKPHSNLPATHAAAARDSELWVADGPGLSIGLILSVSGPSQKMSGQPEGWCDAIIFSQASFTSG